MRECDPGEAQKGTLGALASNQTPVPKVPSAQPAEVSYGMLMPRG